MLMKPFREALDGWGAIAAHLSAFIGISVSKDQCRRYAAREDDPLPAKRVGRLERQRVVAEAEALEEWARREWTQYDA